MLRIFTGKPGGGKSYHALASEIVEELVWGTRVVTTSLAVLPAELAAFLHERYPKHDYIDLHKRLRVLTDEEARKFWLHPMPGVDIPDTSPEEQQRGIFPDFTPYTGVLFVLDEAHKHFDARAFQTEGYALTHVNSQHRKLDWELVFITQFPELISKRVKGFAQEWHNCRNYGLEKIFNIFKMPARFMVKVTLREPSEKQEDPGNYHFYAMDFRIAKCYDTSAGIGIKGRKKPEQRKQSGISLFWLVPVGLAGLAALYYLPDLATRGLLGTAGGKSVVNLGLPSKTAVPVATVPSAPTPAYVPQAVPVPLAAAAPFVAPSPIQEERKPANPLLVRGYAVRGDRVNVVLSDGRTLTENDRLLTSVDRNGVVVDGRKLWMALPEARPQPSPTPTISSGGGRNDVAVVQAVYQGERVVPLNGEIDTGPMGAGGFGGGDRSVQRPKTAARVFRVLEP